jgi:hypothetical protein
MSTPDPAADPRFVALLAALKKDRKFAPIVRAFAKESRGSRKFGSNALKVEGRIFAMFAQGKLVVKLPKERVDELIAQDGERFDPGHGRLMKEWVGIDSDGADWLDLVKEAHRYVK